MAMRSKCKLCKLAGSFGGCPACLDTQTDGLFDDHEDRLDGGWSVHTGWIGAIRRLKALPGAERGAAL